MKKFTKLFLSCAAMAAVTAAVATSAMAADITGDFTGKYDEETKTVEITTDVTPAEGTQVTFLVFEGEKDVTVDANTIKGIDQGTTIQPANNGLMSDVGTKDEKTVYTVMLGYDDGTGFKPYTASFTLGSSGEGVKILVGDTNDDEEILPNDASNVLKYTVSKTNPIKYIEQADTNSDEEILPNDATNILKYTVNKPPYGITGTTITVENPTPATTE